MPHEPSRRLPRLLVVFVPCVASAGAWWTGHPIVAPSDVTSLALVAQSKVTQLVAPSSATQPVAQSNAQQQPSAGELSLLDAPPARMREALQVAYRLAPDQRCLLAFGEIDAWVSGAPAPPRVESRFECGPWSVRIDQREVVRLLELAEISTIARVCSSRGRAPPPPDAASAG